MPIWWRSATTGSYSRVAAFAREWRADRQREQQTTGRGTFVPLAFRPGEAFQFDWSEDWAIIGGERTKLQVAHIKLSHSRAFLLRAYLLQTHEMLFDAHWHAFRVFGGVPRRGIYDNMKTAVDRVGRGKERQVNVRFLAMASHYVFEPEFCNPAAGWEKGQVEKNVQDARHRLWQPMPGFPDLAALNAWLEQRCLELWQRDPAWHAARHDRRRLGRGAGRLDAAAAGLRRLRRAEQARLADLPDQLRAQSLQRAGVLRQPARQPAGLSGSARRRGRGADPVRASRGSSSARHHLPPRTIYDWRHYLAVIQRKPGALRNGAPFAELPAGLPAAAGPAAADARAAIARWSISWRWSCSTTNRPCWRCGNGSEAEGVATKTHVLNLLHRLIDGKTIGGPDIDTPQALTLRREPKANVERYDGLRAQIAGGRHAS